MSAAPWAIAALRRRWRYVPRGRDYARGRVDCAGLVLGIAREHLGLELPDPLYSGVGEWPAAIEGCRPLYNQVAREQLAPGDLVLLLRGRRWHVGMYAGGGRLLQMTEAGVSLPALPQRVEGFYRFAGAA